MKSTLTIASLVVAAAFFSSGEGKPERLATERLFATSNLWNAASARYEQDVRRIVCEMASRPECGDDLVAWYESVTCYDETPVGGAAGEWLARKARTLELYARLPCVAGSTNAWMHTALWMARLGKTCAEEPPATGAVTVASLDSRTPSEINDALHAQALASLAAWNASAGKDEALAVAGDLVTNHFPRTALLNLGVDERSGFMSNICAAAGIKAPEMCRAGEP